MIKFKTILTAVMLVVIFLATPDMFAQGIKKTMKIGYARWVITDSADEGEGSWGWGESRTWYFGFGGNGIFSSKGVHMACTNWTDEEGTVHPIKTSGHGQWEVDDLREVMPIPDEEGWTVHLYYRYQPPAITIDGIRWDDPFPLNRSDHVDPGKLPGNADALIESFINTSMGVSIHHRVIGFSQERHNKYIIREYIFKNTGNIDLDDEIELPNQTITDWYFLKQLRILDEGRPWCNTIGQLAGDDLDQRIMWGYASRQNEVNDDFGGTLPVGYYGPWDGIPRRAVVNGEQIIFASDGPNDWVNGDPNQPHATVYLDVDFHPFVYQSRNHTSTMRQDLHLVMREGALNLEGVNWPQLEGTRPGTFHGVPTDQRGPGYAYPQDMEGFGYSMSVAYSIGPYDLAPGDSVKLVTAEHVGNLDTEFAWEIGNHWLNMDDPAEWAGPDELPQVYADNPDLLVSSDNRTVEMNRAKNAWIYSGFDSLKQSARAAYWAWENNYNVPAAPPSPNISVQSLPNEILVSWGNESEVADDFAGYRVYRALGSFWPHVEAGTELIGVYEQVFECGEGTGNPVVYEFSDTTPIRGNAYFYAVTAFDDGTANGNDFDGPAGVLESTILHNFTTSGANLVKPGGTLDQIVVAPNPYNLSAADKNFPGEPNKIMFFNVPSTCTIRIFTETGDLVKVIEHVGAGDKEWGDIPQEHQATDIGQIVTSGLYIAHIETPDGSSTVRKFVVVR
jgi:hypothetical protein